MVMERFSGPNDMQVENSILEHISSVFPACVCYWFAPEIMVI
jgi:hypothetical protein